MDMSPKSSDGEKKDGLLVETDPMEVVASSSLLGKRKVESPTSDCSDDDEDAEDSDPNWDKDSFDGREYHSSEDQQDYLNDEDFERRSRFYKRTVVETKGFFKPSEDFPTYILAGIVTVWDLEAEVHPGVTCRQFLADMACMCLAKFNRRKEKNVKFENVLRANFHPKGSRTKYYITFAARETDSPDAPLVEYQAKATRYGGETFPILCRPTVQ
ncbi:unnamed protein product [Thlaspi arvense]|uniref:Cystatin domain-containing protein n=1 Tax=Thlaspi arvense TaxID=13288 RepID=A0AAU9S2N7_THLAR|nr:unnamed protein product [Thlaspi arvense]